MTKKPSEGKAPITGRSARDRAKARKASAAGAARADKERREAIAVRSRVVLGEIAEALASDHRAVRQLMVAAMRRSGQPDVQARLRDLTGGREGIASLTDYNPTWDVWQQMRRINGDLETVWARLETLLTTEFDTAEDVFEDLFVQIEVLVTEWEKLIGVDHPAGQLMRITATENTHRTSKPNTFQDEKITD